MADFKSPGFFEREIEVFPVEEGVRGTPALVVGTASRGKAFVPITVGNSSQLSQNFGDITEFTPGTHAAFRFLENRDALTYLRVLGGGANDSASDTAYTSVSGWAKNAGFRLVENSDSDSSEVFGGGHYFLVADHQVSSSSYPLVTSVIKRHANSIELDEVYTVLFENYQTGTALDAGDLIELTFNVGLTSPVVVSLASTLAIDSEAVAQLLETEIAANSDLSMLSITVVDSTVTISGPAGVLVSIIPSASANPVEPTVTQIQNGAERTIVPMLRAQIMCADGYSAKIDTVSSVPTTTPDRVTSATTTGREFKIVILKTKNSVTSIHQEFVVSLEPTDTNYIGRILNKDFYAFSEKGYVLWREWEISSSIGEVLNAGVTLTTGVDTAHDLLPQDENGDPQTHLDVLSRYNSRYRNSVSPWIVSQPLGASNEELNRTVNSNVEDFVKVRLSTRRLFRLHTISDGSGSALEVKVSIRNVRASTNPTDLYGTFDVVVRKWDDTDSNQVVLETFPGVNLNPRSERYIARVIGDSDVKYNWDAANPDERRIVALGRYSNRSRWIRVEMADEVIKQTLPVEVLPFGYEGVEAPRLAPNTILNEDTDSFLESALAVVPPAPLRKKVTRGVVNQSQTFLGEASTAERVDPNLHWGLQWEEITTAGLWNSGSNVSELVKTLCLHNGTALSGQLFQDDKASEYLDNEFSLAYVALNALTLSQVRSSRVRDLVLNAYYLRGEEIASIDTNDFRVEDAVSGDMRITLGTLLSEDVELFNRLNTLCKFTVPLQGGWDGTNPLFKESDKMTDYSSSLEGAAQDGFIEPGFVTNVAGYGFDNNTVYSLLTAAEICTDPIRVSANVIATPGYRDAIIADEFANRVRSWGLALYLMDIPAYDDSSLRIFTGEARRPSVSATIREINSRNIDNNYVATYFPDVVAPLPNGRRVRLPASCAALAAVGFSDAESFPWFAPAGFNRGSLSWVEGVAIRLRTSQRDDLYDSARVNPIYSGTISDGSYAILGQKTMQLAVSALDRVNVRRMAIEAKRILINSMKRVGIFEQNDATTRANFISAAFPQLNVIRLQQGATSLELVCDESNNSPQDVENGIIRARCVVVPTRVAEFIAFDFFISSSGDFGFLDS